MLRNRKFILKGSLKLRKIAISSNSKDPKDSNKTLKSLFEATGVDVAPKMASCRILENMGRFVKLSPENPL